jgi:alanine racemase
MRETVRPTFIEIDKKALQHNIMRIKTLCPAQKIVAMVKANAYGCSIEAVVPAICNDVDAFGVACIEEASKLRQYTSKPCILFQGIFSDKELPPN